MYNENFPFAVLSKKLDFIFVINFNYCFLFDCNQIKCWQKSLQYCKLWVKNYTLPWTHSFIKNIGRNKTNNKSKYKSYKKTKFVRLQPFAFKERTGFVQRKRKKRHLLKINFQSFLHHRSVKIYRTEHYTVRVCY